MTDVIAFAAVFCLFMLRASLFDWKSIFTADELEGEVHFGIMLLTVMIAFVVAMIVYGAADGTRKALDGEFKGRRVSIEEVRGLAPAEVGSCPRRARPDSERKASAIRRHDK